MTIVTLEFNLIMKMENQYILHYSLHNIDAKKLMSPFRSHLVFNIDFNVV